MTVKTAIQQTHQTIKIKNSKRLFDSNLVLDVEQSELIGKCIESSNCFKSLRK